MTHPKIITGGCICGAVRYEIHGPLRQIVACHCEQCRRFSGHFVAATATRKRYFQYLKRDGLKWYSYQSGLRQGFCQDCGSSLFFEDEYGDRISIAAGSLDEAQGLTIAAHIFAAEAGDYYHLDPNVPVSQAGDHSVVLPK
ncbi:GFA family protein [Thiolinea disciformis]|uniref:GFA family protein n=1 Tax=Thiolinea disciformis TaxID=125614 RepID=UPI00037AD871|nr:GFA family protein [Thiolinea disciformis]